MNEDIVKKALQRADSYLPSNIIDIKHNTPQSAILKIYLSMLIDSYSKLQALSNKHAIEFVNLLDATYRPAYAMHSTIHFSYLPEQAGRLLTKGTQVQGKSEEDTLLTLTLQDNVFVSDVKITDIYCCNKTGKIVHDSNCNTIYAFDFTKQGQQKYAFCFQFPYLLEEFLPNVFNLHFMYQGLPANMLMEFLSKPAIKWFISSDNEIICPLTCTTKEDSVEITIQKNDLEVLQSSNQKKCITVMMEELIDIEELYFDTLHVSCLSYSYFADYVYVGEIPEDSACFMPFGKELEPFTCCYIAFDKVLCKKDARITLKWHQKYQKITINPFETATKEYHMIMRSLPKAPLKIQDVYPDIVVLEYFNGEEWTSIPEWKEERHQFQKSIDKDILFTFICPSTIDKVNIEGIEAYWLRFRLLQCNQRYLYPCCLHVPIIENICAKFTYDKEALTINTLEIYHQLSKKNVLSKILRHDPILPFTPSSITHECMYWYLDNPVIEDPFTVYLYIPIEGIMKDTYRFYGSSKNGFSAIQVEDGTDGFCHSGILRFYFHHRHGKMTLFNREGYWIRIERCQMQQNKEPILIEEIIPHVGRIVENNKKQVMGSIAFAQEDFIYDFNSQEVYDVTLSMFEENNLGEGTWQTWTMNDSNSYRTFCLEDTLLRVFAHNILQGNVQKYQITYRQYENKQQHMKKGSEVFFIEAHPFIDKIITCHDSYGSLSKETTKQAITRVQHTLQYNHGVITKSDVYSYFKYEYRNIVDLKAIHNHDAFNNHKKNLLTVAILTDDFALGSPSLYDSISMFEQTLASLSFLSGRNIDIVFREPIYLHVCLSLTISVCNQDVIKIQKQVETYFEDYFHPITGRNNSGWKIGEYPQRMDVVEAVKLLHSSYIVRDCQIQYWYRYQGKKIVRGWQDIHHIVLGCIVFDKHDIKVIEEE